MHEEQGPASGPQPANGNDTDERPAVLVDFETGQRIRETEAALAARDDLNLYVRDGRLVSVQTSTSKRKRAIRDDAGSPLARDLELPALRAMLTDTIRFEQLVTARIIEPTSKQDAARVLEEAGAATASYSTVKRRLPGYATSEFRNGLSGACAARADLGPSALLLYDVTTLWFETDTGDGFREPGFSKERRLEPQITVGLLTDASGAPLMVDAFEGNRAETRTMIPIIRGFVDAHGIAGVTVVADAGMMSEQNLKDVEDAGWSFIVGGKLPDIPYQVAQWARNHPDTEPPDQLILTQPTLMGPNADQRRRTTLPVPG